MHIPFIHKRSSESESDESDPLGQMKIDPPIDPRKVRTAIGIILALGFLAFIGYGIWNSVTYKNGVSEKSNIVRPK